MYPMDRSPVPVRDPDFMESISKTMRVPDRLSMGLGQDQDQDLNQTEVHPVYSMQVPDRLTYAEAADLSPRPQFGPKSKPPVLEVCVESPLEAPHRDSQQSPIRRSMSDQSFGTPGTHNRALVMPRQKSSSRRPVRLPSVSPQPPPVAAPPPPLGPLSARSLMQMGLQASQRLLQVVNSKYRFMRDEPPPPQTQTQTQLRPEAGPGQGQVERSSSRRAMENWSAEDEGGAAVELIVLRRQVVKMSRRLASLERHNSERRSTEFVLFCLLGSACLLNAWLWIRR
ncbi:mitochondrial fission factor-like isoform X1 [Boleophthalmus pectinirostris]|uniref:mitochondrial fission factor-like isoform X1 n=1 Tax=Boleophthalmus pectinirostris TaxID=150288 RepID=UPI002430B3AE|nr:mitochondrial fission factor-like isoform X1 [Boleophthalmus pectinirostris]